MPGRSQTFLFPAPDIPSDTRIAEVGDRESTQSPTLDSPMEFTQDMYQGGIQAPGNEAGLSQGHGQSGHEGP